MNKIERAAEVIRKHGFDPCQEPECIATDLSDAGLLAPDLPGGYPDTGEDGETIDYGSTVARLELGDVWDKDNDCAYWPDEAERHALALLAAAKAAKGNHE